MIDLSYKYISPNKIFEDITFIKDFDETWNIIIISLIIIWIFSVLYLLPLFYSIKENYFKEKTKRWRNLLLKQIIMQKELEDEILKEIKKH
jgi:hypothetical protein